MLIQLLVWISDPRQPEGVDLEINTSESLRQHYINTSSSVI
jgi:hypothetical protein